MRSRFSKGFSLVELMIVVAIIGILAAIAIPNFIAMQLKAKRSEVPGNVDGIKTAQLAYDAAFDGFVANPTPRPRPIAELDRRGVPWVDDAGFREIGWTPDGPVRGTYWTEVSADGQDFVVHGMIDIDQDGEPAHAIATRERPAALVDPDEL